MESLRSHLDSRRDHAVASFYACEFRAKCAAELAQFDRAMAVWVGLEEFQRGAQMQLRARYLALFEFVILEGAQAGLSWSTILNKRFVRFEKRAAIEQFDAFQKVRVDFVHKSLRLRARRRWCRWYRQS